MRHPIQKREFGGGGVCKHRSCSESPRPHLKLFMSQNFSSAMVVFDSPWQPSWKNKFVVETMGSWLNGWGVEQNQTFEKNWGSVYTIHTRTIQTDKLEGSRLFRLTKFQFFIIFEKTSEFFLFKICYINEFHFNKNWPFLQYHEVKPAFNLVYLSNSEGGAFEFP